jgi:hypothetical protein
LKTYLSARAPACAEAPDGSSWPGWTISRGDHPSQLISPAEVTFEARQDSEGRLVIGLVLTREGRPAAGDKVFTFNLVPDLTPPEVDDLVEVLNNRAAVSPREHDQQE